MPVSRMLLIEFTAYLAAWLFVISLLNAKILVPNPVDGQPEVEDLAKKDSLLR
jgi:hypothetical protein